METYVRLNSGAITEYTPKGINITESFLAALAAKNGYKLLVTTSSPGTGYTKTYEETENTITEVWTAPGIDDLKTLLLNNVEAIQNDKFNVSTDIEVEGVGTVLYDSRAEANITALIALALDADVDYTMADNTVSSLTYSQLELIAAAFMTHIESTIYGPARAQRDAINAATTVEELLTIEIV